MPSIGPLELVIVLAIVLVVFGPKRLPGLGRSLGSGMKEFKDSITGRHDDDEDGEGLAAELEATKAEARSAGEAPRAANEVDGEPAEQEAPGPRA